MQWLATWVTQLRQWLITFDKVLVPQARLRALAVLQGHGMSPEAPTSPGSATGATGCRRTSQAAPSGGPRLHRPRAFRGESPDFDTVVPAGVRALKGPAIG